MHTFGENGAGVPAFLAKLWRLVDDPETNGLICWNKDGRSFIIQNQAKFARELLPLNYKHNNMASFIRQLNMYGFHKITSIENGGLKFDRDEMEFSHPCFKRNHPYLLEHIKRKIATSKNAEEKAALKPEAVTKVLQDVRAMRGRQDSLDSRFSVMKQENEALWREIASLRQKHAKQQQIVNKLIQFLITIVQPTRNMTGVKRHMQLMINDTPESAKLRKSSECESEPGSGPVIHELGEELLDEVADTVGQLYNNDDCASPSPIPMERPNSSISMSSQNYDYSNQSAEDLLNNMPGTPQSGNGSTKGPPAVIKSINPDGSQVVYHVTEIPDAHPPETPKPQLPMNDDNVLQTPMVREQIARAEQLLKQKNNRRRKNEATSETIGNNGKQAAAKQARLQAPAQPESTTQHSDVQIKSEQKLDPMQFLNVYTDNSLGSPAASMSKLQQQQLLSPMLNDDSQQSQQSMGMPGQTIISPAPSPLAANMSMMTGTGGSKCGADSTTSDMNDALSLYSSNFIDNEIPSDIFEDSSILSAGDNSNNSSFNQNLKLALQQQQQQDSDNYLLSKINNGKFAAYINGSNANGTATNGNGIDATNGGSANVSGGKLMSTNDGPSTSTAAAGAGSSKNGAFKTDDELNCGKNSNNMAVTQYKPADMRNDVHGHIDSLQDELDSLKELLRGDGYSLDNNMLMSLNKTGTLSDELVNYSLKKGLDEDIFTKLFNDSDILGPYGLQMSMDGQNEKKGSELISYQPSYDLSDIMNINNESNLDTVDDDCANPSNAGMPQSSSVLNTPYHD